MKNPNNIRFIFTPIAVILVIGFSCGKDDKTTDPQNSNPVITSLTADPDTFYAGSSSIITVIADDPDGDVLSYYWEAHGSHLMPMPSGSNTMELTNCCPIAQPESAVVLSVVEDGRGGEARDSIELWIFPSGSR